MNKTAIITGASGGLGSELTKQLLEQGWHIIAATRAPSKAKHLQMLAETFNKQLQIVKADITKQEGLTHLQQIAAENGNVSLLINNAGTANGKALESATLQEFKEVLNVNVLSVFQLTKLLLPTLQKNSGTVVNISSIVGSIALPYLGMYCASKHALNAMTIAMHLELLEQNINMVLVQPGPLSSKLCGDAIAKTAEDKYQQAQTSMRSGVRNVGKRHGVSVEKAAAIIIKSLHRPKKFKRVIIGRWAKTVLLIANIVPFGIMQRALAWHYKVRLRKQR